MLKGFIAGALFIVLAGSLAVYVALRTGMLPANADARPPQIERWAARMSLRATLQRQAGNVTNPLPATDENLIAGIKLYVQNCAVCHGTAGGTQTDIAKGLYQHPPQLPKHGVEDDPDSETYWKVAHGIRFTGMPAFGKSLTETQVWQLTLLLKNMDHLPPASQKAWWQVKV